MYNQKMYSLPQNKQQFRMNSAFSIKLLHQVLMEEHWQRVLKLVLRFKLLVYLQIHIVVPDPAPHRTLLTLKLWRGSFPSILNTCEIIRTHRF